MYLLRCEVIHYHSQRFSTFLYRCNSVVSLTFAYSIDPVVQRKVQVKIMLALPPQHFRHESEEWCDCVGLVAGITCFLLPKLFRHSASSPLLFPSLRSAFFLSRKIVPPFFYELQADIAQWYVYTHMTAYLPMYTYVQIY